MYNFCQMWIPYIMIAGNVEANLHLIVEELVLCLNIKPKSHTMCWSVPDRSRSTRCLLIHYWPTWTVPDLTRILHCHTEHETYTRFKKSPRQSRSTTAGLNILKYTGRSPGYPASSLTTSVNTLWHIYSVFLRKSLAPLTCTKFSKSRQGTLFSQNQVYSYETFLLAPIKGVKFQCTSIMVSWKDIECKTKTKFTIIIYSITHCNMSLIRRNLRNRHLIRVLFFYARFSSIIITFC